MATDVSVDEAALVLSVMAKIFMVSLLLRQLQLVLFTVVKPAKVGGLDAVVSGFMHEASRHPQEDEGFRQTKPSSS